MSEEQNATENVAKLENLSPRELREQIQNLTLEVDLWKTQTQGARLERNTALAELNTLREATPQPALVRTLQQKIVNQRRQLKALQKAYDEQVQRGLSLADWIDRATKAEAAVSEFVKTHCGLCQAKLEPCDCDEDYPQMICPEILCENNECSCNCDDDGICEYCAPCGRELYAGAACDCESNCTACGQLGTSFAGCDCEAATSARDYKGIAEALKGEVTQ